MTSKVLQEESKKSNNVAIMSRAQFLRHVHENLSAGKPEYFKSGLHISAFYLKDY